MKGIVFSMLAVFVFSSGSVADIGQEVLKMLDEVDSLNSSKGTWFVPTNSRDLSSNWWSCHWDTEWKGEIGVSFQNFRVEKDGYLYVFSSTRYFRDGEWNWAWGDAVLRKSQDVNGDGRFNDLVAATSNLEAINEIREKIDYLFFLSESTLFELLLGFNFSIKYFLFSFVLFSASSNNLLLFAFDLVFKYSSLNSKRYWFLDCIFIIMICRLIY